MARKRIENAAAPERSGPSPARTRTRRGPSLPSANGFGESDVRNLAYRKWEEAGCPDGDGVAFWLAAESELRTSVNGQS